MKLPLFLHSEKRRRRDALRHFPAVSGAYTYTPTVIRGWVNSRGVDRHPFEWERANIRIVARRSLSVAAEVQVGPVVKEGPLVDGRRAFILPDHRLSAHELLTERVTLHIVVEGAERGLLKLYSSEQMRLIPEVFPDTPLG